MRIWKFRKNNELIKNLKEEEQTYDDINQNIQSNENENKKGDQQTKEEQQSSSQNLQDQNESFDEENGDLKEQSGNQQQENPSNQLDNMSVEPEETSEPLNESGNIDTNEQQENPSDQLDNMSAEPEETSEPLNEKENIDTNEQQENPSDQLDNMSTEPEETSEPLNENGNIDTNEQQENPSNQLDNMSTEPEETFEPLNESGNSDTNEQQENPSNQLDNMSAEPEETSEPLNEKENIDTNEQQENSSDQLDNMSTEPEETSKPLNEDDSNQKLDEDKYNNLSKNQENDEEKTSFENKQKNNNDNVLEKKETSLEDQIKNLEDQIKTLEDQMKQLDQQKGLEKEESLEDQEIDDNLNTSEEYDNSLDKNKSNEEHNKFENDSFQDLENQDNETEEEKSNLEKQKEALKKLKDKLNQYKEKQEKLENSKESIKNEEVKNEFLESLKDLPSFLDRDKGRGYSIDISDKRKVSEIIIKTLINKFLNQRFTRKQTDLNVRSNSLEKTNGFHKWEIKDVIVHLETKQYTKVLTDKYGYDYSNGKNENVPLSFYFDMSGSMSTYSSLLAVIVVELLKKNIKVLVGFNEIVNVQIESIDKSITITELVKLLEKAGSYRFSGFNDAESKIEKENKINYKLIDKSIDKYLIEKKAEKTVIFSDFDSIDEVNTLSNYVQVYYFCFENDVLKYKLDKFKGFLYKVQNEQDLERGLLKVNEKRFESLMYLDNPESIKERRR